MPRMSLDSKTDIAALIAKARKAQKDIEFKSQEEVDNICARLARSAITDKNTRQISELLVHESQMGNVESKIDKMKVKIRGVYAQMKDAKTVGIIEQDREKRLMKIAKPIGVIAATIPVTNGEATPFCKALSAIKTRNAIIFSPHPRAIQTGKLALKRMKAVLERCGWPLDLIQIIEEVSKDITAELMAQADLVLATGGASIVKAAYSSGKPALGGGVGNSVTIIDTVANTDEAAEKIMQSNTFDYASSCSTENACLVHESMAEQMKTSFNKAGAHILSESEKIKLQKALWPDGGRLNRDIVARSPERIAEIAGFELPKGKTFFVVEETGIGKEYPFSGEKLSSCLAMYRYRNFDEAIDMVNRITAISGPGHSCGIHTSDEQKVVKLGTLVNVARVMVNQPQCLANSGSWTNGMPMSLTLGCGTWSGNSSSENITYKSLMNTTWISWPIASTEPSLEELFTEDVLSEEWD